MQIKFETKSARVKGLSFHPNRPWILSALFSGEIDLWDYRIGTLLHKFVEHEGAVRSVCFHKTQPLFVSGGDDTNIIGWNYKNKQRAFVLRGHLDYIRTVSFHHELPWILSASDDCTIRIWNYVSRAQLTMLSGHTNLVMCAQFHPKNDLIISCSLDQTLRLWDFSTFKKKYTTVKTSAVQSPGLKSADSLLNRNDVEVRAILEGHEKGINWCAFHPTGNLIASVGDDKKVKLWKFSEGTGKTSEYDLLHGHSSNVTCVLFHDKLDVILSNSEDKTIRVWDSYKRTCIDTFQKDTDRYWMLAAHPQVNYIAAGYDTGFCVFTLESERVCAVMSPNQQDVFYVHKKQLVHRDIKTGRETTLKEIDHIPTGTSLKYHQPTALYYNGFNNGSHNIIVHFKDKEKIYHKYFYFSFNLDISRAKNESTNTFRYCMAAIFVTKDRIAILSNTKEVRLFEPGGSLKAITNLPAIDMIYPAGLNKLILCSGYYAMLYDTAMRKIVYQIELADLPKLKQVAWNSKYSQVALLCRKTVFILNKNFSLVTTIYEKSKVTSAAWTNDGVLIYTTKTHIKYALTNGDEGIIKCLDAPLYLIQVKDNEILAIDTEASFQSFTFNREEYLFKLALKNKDITKIKSYISNDNILGNSMVSYLYKKNYSAVALNMVNDNNARFSLALDSGNLEVAYQTCHEQLKNKESYAKLGEEAMRQGNHQINEIACQQTRNFDTLSMLYLVTGNLLKLQKMLVVAQKRGDTMSRFHNALYLGDVRERVSVLAEAGLIHLAYLTASSHNISDMAEALKQSLDDIPTLNIGNSKALIPPKPLILNPKTSAISLNNWPHHQIQEEELLLVREGESSEDTNDIPVQELELNIDSATLRSDMNRIESSPLLKDLDEAMGANWGVDDIVEIPDIDLQANTTNQNDYSSLGESTFGKDPLLEKTKNSQLVGELVVCGDFEGASSLLRRQIGVKDISPFLPFFQKVFRSSQVKVSGLPFINAVRIQMSQDGKKLFVLGSLSQLRNILRVAYKLTTDGKFAESLNIFREILLQIPLLVLQNHDEQQDVDILIRICYNYILALRFEIAKRQTQNDAKRLLELSAYMSCCPMEPLHRILVLRNAMALAYKSEDFIYAAHFAKKILQLAEAHPNAIKADKLENTKKVFAACEQKGTNKHTIVFEQNWLYDNDAIFKFCAKSLTVIQNNQIKRDPFVKASYKAEFEGQTDDIADICTIGADCLGLKLY